MRAWRFHEPGNIENLRLEEAPAPVPKEGEVLVRMVAAALNPADRYLVQGQYPRAGVPPFTPGRDGAGIVEQACASGRFRVGDQVVLLGGLTGISEQGTLAEYAAIPEDWLAPLPDGWTMQEGAAAPLVYLTAWRALVICGGLEAGQTVLVTGASGGVGTAAVMLASSLGARVMALSRSPKKRKRLEELGALALDASAPDIEKQVKSAADGGRVDLIVENLGGPYLNQCARMIGFGGRIMVVGLLAGLNAEVTVGLLIHKCIRIEGVSVSAYRADEARQAWDAIVARLTANSLRPVIDSVFSMPQVQEAFAHMQRGPFGKVLLKIRDSNQLLRPHEHNIPDLHDR